MKNLSENLNITDISALNKVCNSFALLLINKKIIRSQHADLTASDVLASDYSEELGNAIKDEIIVWIDTINRRSGR